MANNESHCFRKMGKKKKSKTKYYHLKLGSDIKTDSCRKNVILLTHQFQVLSFSSVAALRSRSLNNQIKGPINENYFVYLLLLLPTSPLEVAASFKSTIPIVIAASGKKVVKETTRWQMGDEEV